MILKTNFKKTLHYYIHRYNWLYYICSIVNISFAVFVRLLKKIFFPKQYDRKAINFLSARRTVFSMVRCYDIPAENFPEIDISVVTYNSEKWIDNFVNSLLQLNYPLKKIHLYFTDHKSKDATIDFLNKKVKLLEKKFGSININVRDNLGFGVGHDYAINLGCSDFVLVTNIDIEFYPDTLKNLMQYVFANSTNNVASWELRQTPYEHPKYYDPVTLETNWSSHACILLRKSAYKQVGGYEKLIFMYTEDVELSYRFRSFGYRLIYCPSAVVKHFCYTTEKEIKPLQFKGCLLGNAYIRLRYGTLLDKLGILVLYAIAFLFNSSYKGARKDIIDNVKILVKNMFDMLKGKSTAKCFYPICGFDYELNRKGAFYKINACCFKGPLVSVIVRTYRNRNRFLYEALTSIYNQTYENIEIIVVEDGGNSMQELVKNIDKNIQKNSSIVLKYFSCDKIGRSATGNIGLQKSSGKYVMFLDDDDMLFADHVEILVASLLSDDKVDAMYSLPIEIETDRRNYSINETYFEKYFSMPQIFEQEFDYNVLLYRNLFPIQSVMFKRDLYLERGGFKESLETLEDWYLWSKYAYAKNFKYIPKTTSLYRVPCNRKEKRQRNMLFQQNYQLIKALISNKIQELEQQQK